MSETTPSFLQQTGLRLLLFSGKGGVGKTTCAAAAALCLAARSPRQTFLLVSTDPAHSLQPCLRECALPPNLRVLEIDARESFTRFTEAHREHLRQIAERGTFLDDSDVSRLLELSMPGLDEIMAFNDIAALVDQKAYSCVLVDTAPTGHALRFLALPGVLRAWIRALDAMLAKHRYLAALYRGACQQDASDRFLEDLAESVERLARLLTDESSCRLVPVMLADPLSVAETRRLIHTLEAMGIPVADIVVNRLRPAASDCPVCREIVRQEQAQLSRLPRAFPRYTLWGLPLQGAEVHGAIELRTFWNRVRPLPPPHGAARVPEPARAAR